MAETTASPNNKLVAFGRRPSKEFTRAYKRGLISDKAVREVRAKKKSKFAKKAGHNPPKPAHATAQPTASAMEAVSRPVAAAASQIGKWFGKSSPASTVVTMGIRG